MTLPQPEDIYRQIVAELAEHPLTATTDDGFTRYCVFCLADATEGGHGRLGGDDPSAHEPNCLWVRARAAIAAEGDE